MSKHLWHLAVGALLALCGCTVNITSSGDGATFELSPCRELAHQIDADVGNGLTAAAKSPGE